MYIDGNLIPIFAIGVGFIITITAILSDSISKTKLKTEQIRADALVRAEEVRAKNQLELEKLMRQEHGIPSSGTSSQETSAMDSEDFSRQRSRVRE